MKRLPWARRAAKVALPPIQRPPRVTPPGSGAVALFGWTLGKSWQRGLVHIWCANPTCRVDLDFAQPQFLARYPNPMCAACAATRPAALPAVVHADAEVIRVAPLRLVPPPPDAAEDGAR